MSRLLFLFVLASMVGGCATGRINAERARTEQVQAERDSLRGALAVEKVRSEAYADSIRFYDSIDSGAYERTLRSLNDRIESLQFKLEGQGGVERPIETFGADDLFEPASATVSTGGAALLDRFARSLREQPANASFRIEGHADASPVGPSLRATFPSNWELAAQRAAAVTRYLISTGLAADRFTVTSEGDTQPVASNATAEGRARNRRVVVFVTTQ